MNIREDEDIKIATETFKPKKPLQDSGEEAARQFLEQKELGNIEKARELGISFAEAIIQIEDGPVSGLGKARTQRELHNQIVLYSYIVNRVIAEHCPNSIVAQSCLGVFYKTVESACAELFSHVSDMAAFSLYVLCERSKNRTDDDIGVIYAELCDFDGREEIISEGNAFYRKLYDYCAEKVGGADFR